MSQLPKICFVAPNMYHLLTKQSDLRGMGGAELQQMMLSRELAKRGYEVSIVTVHHDEGEIEPNLPFRVIPAYRRKSGLPVLKAFYPRLVKTWQALSRSGAELFYLRCTSGIVLSTVVAYARLTGKKVVLSGGNDNDFHPEKVNIVSGRDRRLYVASVPHCHGYVVQNKAQKETLARYYGKDGQVIYNGFSRNGSVPPQPGSQVLWVGSIKKIKHPHGLLDLAERMPGTKFVMIGGNPPKESKDQEAYYQGFLDRVAGIPNVEYRGFMPFQEVEQQFADAKVFLNTSPVEGFPNTFLQAWARGVPTLSYVDPDGLVSRHRLGIVAGDLDGMASGLERLLDGTAGVSREGILGFFDRNLKIERVVDQYLELFQRVLGRSFLRPVPSPAETGEVAT